MTALPRLLLPCLVALLTACAQLPLGPGGIFGDDDQVAAKINRLRTQARVLRYSGRHVEALERLDSALELRPDDPDLRAERVETEKGWRQLERTLHDELLVIETRAEQRRLPLLRRLVRASPEDRALREELDGILKSQAHRTASLAACGRHQAGRAPDLARRCLGLALAAREDQGDRALLKRLTPPAKPAAKAPEKRPAVADTGNTPSPPWVVKARAMMRAGKDYTAIRLLEKMTAKEPDSDEARRLLQEARSNMEHNMDTMLSTGDRLYRQGRVKEALAVWQAAVEMNPENLSAREKSAQALRTLHDINTPHERP